MSRHEIVDLRYEITIGWDEQLQTFFSYVDDPASDDDLIFDVGFLKNDYTDPLVILLQLEQWKPGISKNQELINELIIDKLEGRTNIVRTWII